MKICSANKPYSRSCVCHLIIRSWLLFVLSVCQMTWADVATQLDWDVLTWPAGSTAQSYTIGPGNVVISLNGPSDTPPGDTSGLANGSPFITTDLTGGLSPVQNSLEINVDYPSVSSQQIPILIDFTHPGGVSDVSFSIFDLDLGSWVDVVEVTATVDGVNYFNPTSIVTNSANTSDGINTVTGTSGSVSSANGTATFSFTNSGITQVRVIYRNQTTAFQWIALHDINFTYPESDLALSKSHSGVFNQGDTASYTLSVENITGASDEPGPITVSDTLAAGLTYLAASGSGWTCGAVLQDITCTHAGPLAAGNSLADISLDVLVGAAAVPSVSNTASVTGFLADANTSNNVSTDVASVIGNPAITAGNKPIYLYSDTGVDSDPDLSRTPPITAQSNIRIRKNIELSETWVLSPQTQSALTIDGDSGTIPVELILRKGGTSGSSVSRSVQVTLATSLGVIGTHTRNLSLNGTPSPYTFSIPIAADINLPALSTISLTVTNVTPVSGNAAFRVFPESGGNNSRVELTSETVINVDSVAFYDAPYPAGSIIYSILPGDTVYVRSTVSDPFGSYDISAAQISINDATGSAVVTAAGMSEVFDSNAATKIYQYSYTIPVAANVGNWTFVVSADEGTEGFVADNNAASLYVGGTPDVILLKTSQVISDGLGNVSPIAKAIPGAIVVYRLTATNQGDGATDNNVTVVDHIPDTTSLCVADPCAQGADPIQFTDSPVGTVASGLAFNYAAHVEYSKSAGPTYIYGATLTPDGNGYDSAVTSVRVRPSGSFNAASGATPAGFELLFRVQVQ